MACGLAVLGFDADGARDLVRDGETGLLAPVGEQATFTRMFSQLMEEPQLRARMGLRARSGGGQHREDVSPHAVLEIIGDRLSRPLLAYRTLSAIMQFWKIPGTGTAAGG